jgi:UDP-N-acetylglucosamine:LPS N-acetylglucosamine transferase
MIDDSKFTSATLVEVLSRWQREGIAKRAEAAASCGHKNDVDTFVNIILETARRSTS